jgi:UrcA family protein
MKQTIRIAAIAATLGTLVAFAVPASAATTARTEVVKYNDLNLTTATGTQELYKRLQIAAWRVCRDVVSSGGAASLLERTSCVRELVETAVKDVNKPTLTALHQGKAMDLTASR